MIEIRRATLADIDESSAVLRDAAAFMRTVTDPAWQDDEIGPDFVARQVEKNRWIVALQADQIVGTLSIQTRDLQFWPDRDDGLALYLHKIAVRRAVAGSGIVEAMIDWVCAEARVQKRPALRLDCAPNPRLCARYESLGFRKVDDVRRPWSIIARDQEGTFHVVRYERPV